MIISGTKTEVERVKIEVQPLDALSEINKFVRKHMGINQSCWLTRDKNGKYVLMKEDDYTYHGTPSDELVDDNPSEDVIEYMKAQKAMYEFTRNAQFNRK